MKFDGYEIELEFKGIRYREGDRELIFDREPAMGSLPAEAWFPSPKRWRERMPAWAHSRRGEILSRLRAALPGHEWRVSYSYVDSVRADDLDSDPP